MEIYHVFGPGAMGWMRQHALVGLPIQPQLQMQNMVNSYIIWL